MVLLSWYHLWKNILYDFLQIEILLKNFLDRKANEKKIIDVMERQESLMGTRNCLSKDPLEILGRFSGSKCLLQIINEFMNRTKCSGMYPVVLFSYEKPCNWDGCVSDSAACDKLLLQPFWTLPLTLKECFANLERPSQLKLEFYFIGRSIWFVHFNNYFFR